jgi:type I restriction enzyme S subunit
MTELPAGWKIEPLGRHLKAVQYGLSLPGQQSGRVPILRMNCQVNGKVRFDNLQFVDLDEETFESFRLRRGDILFNRTNSIELVGRTAIFKAERDAVFASYLLRLTCDSNSVCPEFLNYYLNKPETQADLKKLAGRGVSQANINATKLRDFEIVLPPKPEQEKIATAMWKVQRAVEVEEKLIATAREFKQSAMRQLFRCGLRGKPETETDIGPVPQNWRVDRLIELAQFQRGFDITKKSQSHGKVPVVSSGGVKSWHNEAAAKGPGVIIGRKGSIGLVHYVEQDYWPHDTTLWCTDFRGNFPLFVYYRLQVLDLKRLDSGAANPALNRNFLHEEIVSWPEIDEQLEIAAVLRTIDRKICVHERKQATLQELFKTLLHQLMTGQIRVHHLDIDLSDIRS